MAMTFEQEQQVLELRDMIGQPIPEGGTAADTLFENDKLLVWITSTSTMDAAALKGWKTIQAHWAGLVSVSDGASSRAFSDLFDHAVIMVKQYAGLAQGPAYGRSRVGKIVRS